MKKKTSVSWTILKSKEKVKGMRRIKRAIESMKSGSQTRWSPDQRPIGCRI